MKVVKFIILFTILPIVSTSSCEKTTSPPRLNFGTVTADMNGVPWTADVNAGLLYNVDAILVGFNNRTIVAPLVQDLALRVPLQLGIHESDDFGSGEVRALCHIIEVDAICEFYVLATESVNKIEVTLLDTIANRVGGTFNLIFIREQTGSLCTGGLPDTLRFTNGVFESEISRD